jgi:hypothetical protein
MKNIFHLSIKKLGINMKAGLEHHHYPYDLKWLT